MPEKTTKMSTRNLIIPVISSSNHCVSLQNLATLNQAFIISYFHFSEWSTAWRLRACLKLVGLSWVYWCFTSHATIFQSYMWRHRCAGGLKKLYLWSGSQRHRHFAGFFNVPVLHRHGTTLFIRWFKHTAPFSRFLRHAGDTEDVGYGGRILGSNPRRPHGGLVMDGCTKGSNNQRTWCFSNVWNLKILDVLIILWIHLITLTLLE